MQKQTQRTTLASDASANDATGDDATADDATADASTDAGVDADVDAGSPTVALKTPFPKPTSDPLAGSSVTGCDVYQKERCVNNVLQRCALYDTKSKTFVSTPDPLLHRVLLYDRWYDLYHQPDGMSFSREFGGTTNAGTPEATWGAKSHFRGWGNRNDSPIWTGAALIGFAMRYLNTKTRADYLRMERKARAMLTYFEMTGADGYLGRYHFLAVPPGTPNDDKHVILNDADDSNYLVHDLDPNAPGLPDIYKNGVPDGKGGTVKGRGRWRGGPSIDQYSGVLSSLATVWHLLEDNQLKTRIGHHVSCFLKRLKRVEIRNLQMNKPVLAALTTFFAGANLQFDPGDIDISKTDTLVAYVLEQKNSKNTSFNTGCNASIELQATRVLDAASPLFLAEAFFLVSDFRGGQEERATGYDTVYAPNIRGGNAIQMMQLAAAAYQMTKDPQFKAFLEKELIGKLRTLDLADTASSLLPPYWCRGFHGDHITYLPLWSLLTMLDKSVARDRLETTMSFEYYEKRMKKLANANFNVYFAGEVKNAKPTDRQAAIAAATTALDALGGNDGVLDDPRRDYNQDRSTIINQLPATTKLQCPTEQERASCEDGISVFGIKVDDGTDITHTCGKGPGECPLSTGCAWALADTPMPMENRTWGDFIWQKNPFTLSFSPPVHGNKQSAGIELFQTYWLARHYGFITTGKDQVLAWQDVDGCTSP
jgi:hypothetical protein